MSIEIMRKLADAYKLVNEKKMDPVDKKELKGTHSDRKDKDIDNDGDADSSDKYLHKRRKAISKAMGKDEVSMNPKMNKGKDSKAVSNETMEAATPVSDNDPRYKDDENLKKSRDHSKPRKDGERVPPKAQAWRDRMKKKFGSNNEEIVQEGPKDAQGKSIFVKKIAKSAGTSYEKAGAIAAAAGRKRMGKAKFDAKAAAGRRAAAESIIAPVYAKILEKRHGGEGAPKEKWDEKEKNNKGAMDMRKDMKAGNPDIVDNPESEKIKDPSKKAPLRPGDNAKGDSNIIPSATPAKGN